MRAAVVGGALLGGLGTLRTGLDAVRGDVLVLEGGKTVRGAAFRAGEEVRLNPWGCTVPEMTLGVRVYRARDVRRIDPDEDEPWIQARWDGLEELRTPEAAAEAASLAGLARRKGYKDLARRLAEEALARGSTDAECLRAVGGPARWEQRRRGDVRLDAALADAVAGVLALDRGSARRDAARRLIDELGLTLAPLTLERMAQSLQEPVGTREEAPLRWRTAEQPAGTYLLHVPPDAHPLAPRPLVLALHGGGVVTRPDGTQALGGSGRDMLALLRDGAERLGWFLLCPTALEAPWDTPRNRAFLEALLDEVGGRFPVDLARVHVIGVAEGGAGAYALATSLPERFACVGAASAPPPATLGTLLSRGQGVWVFHGDADTVMPVEPVRRAAERALGSSTAFVYCELPKEGHGLPSAAERDWYRFVAGRRHPRARDAWPAPSLAGPLGPVERAVRGDPAAAWGGSLPPEAPEEALWAALAAGGAEADPASERLLARRPGDLLPRASALVKDLHAPPAARGFAAWLLGAAGAREAFGVLGDALRAERDPGLRLRLVGALRRLAHPDSREDLRAVLLEAAGAYGRATHPGGRVPFAAYAATARLLAETVEALALCAQGQRGERDSLVADIEQALVLGVLRDPRPVDARAGPGGDPAEVRRALVRSVARAYRTLEAEPTLTDMLRTVVRKDPRALEALAEGARQGVGR